MREWLKYMLASCATFVLLISLLYSIFAFLSTSLRSPDKGAIAVLCTAIASGGVSFLNMAIALQRNPSLFQERQNPKRAKIRALIVFWLALTGTFLMAGTLINWLLHAGGSVIL